MLQAPLQITQNRDAQTHCSIIMTTQPVSKQCSVRGVTKADISAEQDRWAAYADEHSKHNISSSSSTDFITQLWHVQSAHGNTSPSLLWVIAWAAGKHTSPQDLLRTTQTVMLKLTAALFTPRSLWDDQRSMCKRDKSAAWAA